MDKVQQGFTSIDQVRGIYLNNTPKPTQTDDSDVFQKILGSKLFDEGESVKFSKHASLRLSDRGIDLSTEQTERLADGIERAKNKGIQESLVLMDQLAFIVNVDKSTVITAMDASESDIFTNIDGAVIV